MFFEYDERKSAANLKKHDIDFRKAQRLWDDPELLEIQARSEDESRFLYIGMIDGKHWSAIATPRAEKLRLISVRRSRDSEVAIYES